MGLNSEINFCEYGCGQEDKYQLKNRKWCCSESHRSCPKIVERRIKSLKGAKHPPRTKEWKRKQREAHRGKHSSVNTEFKKGHIPLQRNKTHKEFYGEEKAEKMRVINSESHIELWKNPIYISKQINTPEIRRKKSESKMGDKNPARKLEVKEKIREFRKNKTVEEILGLEKAEKFKEKCKKRMNENNPMNDPKVREKHFLIMHSKEYKDKVSKENHPNWQGGISKLPYSFDFNMDLKRQIRERDGYTCQKCFKPGNCVHHIDGNKMNCDPINLVTTCRPCNTSLANKDKGIWAIFYQPYFETIAKGICV